MPSSAMTIRPRGWRLRSSSRSPSSAPTGSSRAPAGSYTSLATLQSAPYTITPQSDRMAFRLEGPKLAHARGADIISDGTPLGVLQVPAAGQPILLMADRQTTGGYPKIATVISADMALAGQLGPGDTINFSVCTPREAMAALIAHERFVMNVESWR